MVVYVQLISGSRIDKAIKYIAKLNTVTNNVHKSDKLCYVLMVLFHYLCNISVINHYWIYVFICNM